VPVLLDNLQGGDRGGSQGAEWEVRGGRGGAERFQIQQLQGEIQDTNPKGEGKKKAGSGSKKGGFPVLTWTRAIFSEFGIETVRLYDGVTGGRGCWVSLRLVDHGGGVKNKTGMGGGGGWPKVKKGDGGS